MSAQSLGWTMRLHIVSQMREGHQTRTLGTYVVGVVHRHCHALALEIVHFHRYRLTTILGSIHQLQLARTGSDEVGALVLVAERVSTDDDGLDPTWDRFGEVVEQDGFAEDGAVEDVADGPVGRLPHLLEVEFLHASLVGGDGRTLVHERSTLESVIRLRDEGTRDVP